MLTDSPVLPIQREAGFAGMAGIKRDVLHRGLREAILGDADGVIAEDEGFRAVEAAPMMVRVLLKLVAHW